MADASVPMTSKGFQFLMEELKRLKSVERPKNIRDIEEARDHGDLSENAEFHAAKERQSLLDVQIREMEDKIARAQVIDVSKLSGDKVVFGATVSVWRMVIPATRWYTKSSAIMRRSRRTVRFPLVLPSRAR